MLLPITGSLLHPRYPTKEDTDALNGQKRRQEFYYNRQVKPLKPIVPGDTIQMRLPGETTWTSGVCTDLVGPRSYKLRVGEKIYRRNRRQIKQADKPVMQNLPCEEQSASQTSHLDSPVPSQHLPMPTEGVLPSPGSPELRRSG